MILFEKTSHLVVARLNAINKKWNTQLKMRNLFAFMAFESFITKMFTELPARYLQDTYKILRK